MTSADKQFFEAELGLLRKAASFWLVSTVVLSGINFGALMMAIGYGFGDMSPIVQLLGPICLIIAAPIPLAYEFVSNVFAIPLVSAIEAVPVAWLIVVIRKRWRAKAALDKAQQPCPACGYDLRGSPSGQCPECGTVNRVATKGATPGA